MRYSKDLKEHKSSQCRVEFNDKGEIEFWSYRTMVISAIPKEMLRNGADFNVIIVPKECSGDEYVITCSGLYSATTRRQIGWFLREYFGNLNYYNIKDLVEEGPEACIIADLTNGFIKEVKNGQISL